VSVRVLPDPPGAWNLCPACAPAAWWLVTGVAVLTASRDISVSPATSTGRVSPADPI
jgi:hypothetical protein